MVPYPFRSFLAERVGDHDPFPADSPRRLLRALRDTISMPASHRHDAEIQDQFTRQAEHFVQRHANGHKNVLDAMAACAALPPTAAVLDVACGPGIVSCFFAARVRHVTGIDIVPAMLDRARKLQAERGLTNLDWQLGSSTELPFPAAAFDGVLTRFSFHHFLDPGKALSEMARVAKPGGTVLVCDVAPSPATQIGFNQWEILRDPSHTRALTEDELTALGEHAGLERLRKAHPPLEMDLEDLLAGSFPRPGDADRIRALFEEDLHAGTNHLGVAAHRDEDRIRIAYPVLAMAWHKPAHPANH